MAMLALEGEACIAGVEGSVWRPVESLFEGPGVSVVNPTSQLVTHVRFDLPAARWGTAWRRAGRRPSLVLPILNCGVKLCLSSESDLIENAVIALGPVAPVPFRARDSERFLRGQPARSDLFEQAGRIARDESNPRGSFSRASREHRLAIIPYLVSSALREAATSAMGSHD
jgi:carbon-monoxide dehydrogenase medium subunit